jgi:hypothetical protein
MKYNRVLFEQLHPHWGAGKTDKGKYEDPRMQQSYETWMVCKKAMRDALRRSEMRYSERGEVQKATLTAANRDSLSKMI